MSHESETVTFTIATSGYAPFVLNLHASMARVGLGDQLVVHSLDTDVHETLSKAGLRSVLCESDRSSGWSDFGTAEFARAMSYKYTVALGIFEAGANALYLDSDIVVLRDPMEYLQGVLSETSADLMMQFEVPKDVYCAGFWLARPTRSTADLFARLRSILEEADQYVSDQATLNEILRGDARLNARALDPELFACGNQFLDGVSVEKGGFHISRADRPFPMESAYLLHFNYLMGKREKAVAMLRLGVAFHPSMETIAKQSRLRLPRALVRRLRGGS